MQIDTVFVTDANTSKLPVVPIVENTIVRVEVYPSNEFLGVDFQSWATTSLINLEEVIFPEAYQTMIATEKVLARDWNQPDEDEAWADL